jgi:hypothetical protein
MQVGAAAAAAAGWRGQHIIAAVLLSVLLVMRLLPSCAS